ncbi:UNVERIFIED_CONTAM: hypothetical protein HDU68_005443 [Siphonaria sp. JEL0065]|nr:hypothetical protein HDU68_005443 [Siphonaria sp. JEL0065]
MISFSIAKLDSDSDSSDSVSENDDSDQHPTTSMSNTPTSNSNNNSDHEGFRAVTPHPPLPRFNDNVVVIVNNSDDDQKQQQYRMSHSTDSSPDTSNKTSPQNVAVTEGAFVDIPPGEQKKKHKRKTSGKKAAEKKSGTILKSAISLESQQSGDSGVSKVRSGRSSQSSGTDDDTTFGKITRYIDMTRTRILESDQYFLYRKTVDNAKYQILAIGFIQAMLFASIIVVVELVLNSVLPSIQFYNLIHAVVSFQGKLLLLMGWDLSRLVRKGFAAVELINEKKGVPMTEIANVDPESCRQVNRIFLFCLLLVEMGLWIMSYFMDWEPVETYLGSYGCTTPSYRVPWNFTDDLPQWAASNAQLAILESYGLPLASGLIGSQGAIPNIAPSSTFQMTGPGITFLVESVCENAIVSKGPNSTTTTSHLLTNQYWGQIFNFDVQLKYPEGTQNMHPYMEHDLLQRCHVALTTGISETTFQYTSDNWGTITANSILEINVNSKLSIKAGSSVLFDFGVIHAALGDSELTYQNTTSWIAEAVNIVLESDNMQNPNSRGAVAAIMRWGQDVDGYYNPKATWKGLAVAVGIVSHYVLAQSDGTSKTMCDYKGNAGFGVIYAPQWTLLILIVTLICGLLMEVIVVVSWMLVVGGGEGVDRCVAMIDNPLRTLYYMRGSAGRLVSKIAGNDIGHISLLQHLAKVHLRFGEDKSTRGNEIGTLILDDPTNVIKFSRKRKLA